MARQLGQQIRPRDRRGVHRHLVGTGAQQCVDIGHCPDSAADGQWDEHLFGGAAHHVEHGGPARRRRRHVEEGQFVGAFGVVDGGKFHRIPGITQVGEVDTLDHPAGVDIQAGNNPDRQIGTRTGHVNGSPRPGPPAG